MPERPTVPVTVIVLTKNEAANIDACLDAVRDWATAIFVVDSGSTDDTVASELGKGTTFTIHLPKNVG